MRFLRRFFASRDERSDTYPIRKLFSVLIRTALEKGATSVLLRAATPAAERVSVELFTESGPKEIEGLPAGLLKPLIFTLQHILTPQEEGLSHRKGPFTLADSTDTVIVTLREEGYLTYRIDLQRA